MTEMTEMTPPRPDGREGTPDAQLVGVTKTFPGQSTPAVDALSLDIRAGEFFSLLGPSGCGKTTTLRMLAGLEEPSSGRILIRGEDVTNAPAHRRPTNMVFQRLALFPHLSVADNVAYGPRLRKMSRQQVRERVGELLELVHLQGYEKRYPAQLSGGQQQRVAIARALANRPAVLLLDEPLASLDLKLRVQMQQALKEIQADAATTFVFVTHDQTEAMTMSDRIAVMSAGRIEQIATPAELYDRPATRFVATFIGDTNLFEGDYRDGQLDTGSLRIAVPQPGTLASVRPERVALGTDLPTEAVNRFEGFLEQATFLGSVTRYVVALTTGTRIVVERPSADPDSAGLAVGGQVQCALPLDAVVMVDPASTAPSGQSIGQPIGKV